MAISSWKGRKSRGLGSTTGASSLAPSPRERLDDHFAPPAPASAGSSRASLPRGSQP